MAILLKKYGDGLEEVLNMSLEGAQQREQVHVL